MGQKKGYKFSEKHKKNISKCCGKHEKDNPKKLTIHHIDYDKMNCQENNLIAICNSCHGLTNHNRAIWKLDFTTIMGEQHGY